MTEILEVPVQSPKNLTKEIAEISSMMTGHELLFVYQDAVNSKTSESILSITEIRLNISGADKKVKRKVFNVLVECLQNITHHTEISSAESLKRPSVVVLGKSQNHFFITTGNLIHNAWNGLGLIDILRKSGNKVQAEFEQINDELSFFTMKAIISAEL